MIKVAKILSLSLLSTFSAGTVTVVPTLCLSTDSPSQPIFHEPRPIDVDLLNIDENGVLHGFKDDVLDSQLKEFNTLQIPSNVTAIGPYAFAYRFDGQLNNINAIDFSQATNLVSIGDNAFNYCYAIESDIDFSKCPNLASIGLSAFFFCSSIKTLTFASSSYTPLTIGDHAFYACEALKKLNLYDYMKEIKSNAFEQCVGLDTINIIGFTSLPTWMLSSTWIFNGAGSEATDECHIKVPYCNISFDDWDRILHQTQHIPQKWKISYLNQTTADDFNYDKNGNISGLIGEAKQFDALVIPEDVKGINAKAFQNKFSESSLQSKMIPLILHNEIESIGEYAFDNCTNLCSDLHLPANLTKLDAYAFRNCKNLTGEAEIPSGISTISQQVFSGSGITSLKFHPGVKKLEAKCFASCKNLSWIDVSCFQYGDPQWDPQEKQADQPFTGLPNNGVILAHQYLNDPGAMILQWYNKLKALGITNITTEGTLTAWSIHLSSDQYETLMPEKAFNIVDQYNLRGLKKDYLDPKVLVNYGRVRLPNTITTVAPSAFQDVFKGQGIKARLILNDGLSIIDDRAFASCSGLFGNLVIPHTVTAIGPQAFASDTNLQGALLLPGGAAIASDAFSGTNLSKVTFSSNFGMVKNQYEDNAIQISTSTKILDLSNADQVPVVTNAWITFAPGSSGKIIVKPGMKQAFTQYFNKLSSSNSSVNWNANNWTITEVEE